MIVKHLILLCAATVLASTTGLAQAQSMKTPYYFGASVGSVHTDVLDALKRSDHLYDTRTTPIGHRVLVGRRWGPVWATEFSYTYLGKASFKAAQGTGSDEQGWLTSQAFTVWSVWRAQTDMDITLVTRLGASYNQSNAGWQQTGFGLLDNKWSLMSPALGLGMEYALPEGWRLQGTLDATYVGVNDRREMAKYLALGLTKAF